MDGCRLNNVDTIDIGALGAQRLDIQSCRFNALAEEVLAKIDRADQRHAARLAIAFFIVGFIGGGRIAVDDDAQAIVGCQFRRQLIQLSFRAIRQICARHIESNAEFRRWRWCRRRSWCRRSSRCLARGCRRLCFRCWLLRAGSTRWSWARCCWHHIVTSRSGGWWRSRCSRRRRCLCSRLRAWRFWLTSRSLIGDACSLQHLANRGHGIRNGCCCRWRRRLFRCWCRLGRSCRR